MKNRAKERKIKCVIRISEAFEILYLSKTWFSSKKKYKNSVVIILGIELVKEKRFRMQSKVT